MSDVRTTLLFAIKFLPGEPQILGKTPFGERRIVSVAGGTFEGPRLKGTVADGGSDWILVRRDGSLRLDVRLTLKTDDGALIAMTYPGVRHGPPQVMERLNRGEMVDPSEYYFRSVAMFETAAPKYEWLNNIVSVGIGERLPTGPVYRFYEVL